MIIQNGLENKTLVGRLLAERYSIVKLCTSGAFGDTYLAEDIQLSDRSICFIKRFHPTTKNLHLIEVAKLMFEREAKITKSLGSCQKIPQLIASFEEENEYYLVQEFIEGHTLYSELARGNCWKEAQVIQLLQETLSILKLIHSHGIIHRDIKPSNLIRRKQDNQLVLIDFGVVKLLNNEIEEISNYGKYDIIVGTPGYMPCEQAQANSCFNSDIYALGIIAVEALTGIDALNLTIEPTTNELSWEDLVSVNPGLIAIIKKMVRQNYQKRYQSASEVLKALEQYQLNSKSALNFAEPSASLENTLSAEKSVASALDNSVKLSTDSENKNYSQKIILIGIFVSIITTWPIAFALYYCIWLLNHNYPLQNSPSTPPSPTQQT